MSAPQPHPKILSPTSESVRYASDALRRGELIGLPTETVYGLAARADQPTAVQNIFAAKRRPATNPLIIHVANPEAARELVLIDDDVTERRFTRASSLWPGPLTLVLPRRKLVIDLVTGGGDTVGIRVPEHPVALSLLRAVGLPIAAPSANVSNYISPTRPEHVTDAFGSVVTCVLDGGACNVGLESTVLLLADPNSPPKVLRSGSISASRLQERLGEDVCLSKSVGSSGERPMASPGQLAKHYSPRTPLHLVSPSVETNSRPYERTLRIQLRPSDCNVSGYADAWVLSPGGDLHEVANRLYAELRRADAGGFDRIDFDELIAEEWRHSPGRHLADAVADRLIRAARSDD